MSRGKVFLVGGQDAELVPMDETPYAREDFLQELIARYPDLLAGDQITPDEPRRWLLVKREAGVPGEDGGSDRWSLDHLFIDHEGVPTFVECKRGHDTRGRREVVAQMLDYAANGTEYWTIDRVRQDAAETARATNQDLDRAVAELIGSDSADDEAVELFWNTVEENLGDGRVRLVFVADHTPKPLRRLVEFLNAKMTDVEVLAVEIQQFVSDEQKVVVPRVIGMTEAVRAAKARSAPSRRRTTRERVLEEATPAAATIIDWILDDAIERGLEIYWGVKGFSIRRKLRESHRLNSIAYVYPPDRFEIYLQDWTVDPDLARTIRSELLEYGIFDEAGQHTLRAVMREATAESIKDAWLRVQHHLEGIIESEWDEPLPSDER